MLFKIAGFIYFKLWSMGLWTPRDRAYLMQKILPWVAKNYAKVLFVGVQKYTKDYEKMFSSNQAESIDIDPAQARWGFRAHYTVPIGSLKEKGLRYEAIIMNGVIGYGLNNHSECEQFIADCADLLKPQGLLLIGFNPNQLGEVRLNKLRSLQTLFSPIAMDGHNQSVRIRNEFFKSISHDYYFFQKKMILAN